MDSLKAAALYVQVKNGFYFLDIQTKGFLGPTLRERHDTVGLQSARASGVVVDERGRLRCPSIGSTTAYEFTNMQMSNCILQPPAHMATAGALVASRVREVSKLAQRSRPRSFSWSSRENAAVASARYPGARWEERTPGFSALTAGTGRVGDDRRLWKMVNRRWHSDAVVERAEEPGLARVMEAYRNSPTVSTSMRREALDLDHAPAHTRKLADAIDKGYPLGRQSYRVQHVPKKMQIESGFNLNFSLASVAFNPEDVKGYEKDLSDQRPVWFRFPENTPGVIFDDSDKASKRRKFHEGPIDGIVRGKFRVTGKGKEGMGEDEREILDLEYAGKLDDTRETYPQTPTASSLVGHMDIPARQRVKANRNQARSRLNASKKNMVFLDKPNRDKPLRPGSRQHLDQTLLRHRGLFGDKDTERLTPHLVSNETLNRLSPFEKQEKERLRNTALDHMATSAVTYRLATLLDGVDSPEREAANNPQSSRYYGLVQGALERWKVADSGDPFRKALRDTVRRVFDVDEYDTKAVQSDSPVKFNGKEFPSTGALRDDEGFQALALAMYQTTQEGLGKAEPVRLYRGVDWRAGNGTDPPGKPEDWAYRGETDDSSVPKKRSDYAAFGQNLLKGGSVTNVPTKPLTGFTANIEEAVGHAFNKPDSPGSLIETTVPSEQLFSVPGSGFGNPGKEEVTVLGGNYPSRVVSRSLPGFGNKEILP